MGCSCFHQKVIQSTKINTPEQWENKENYHYKSILNSSDELQNYSFSITNYKEPQRDKLNIIIEGSYIQKVNK